VIDMHIAEGLAVTETLIAKVKEVRARCNALCPTEMTLSTR
jgi:(2Fe-2S) ferredoxin